MKRLLLKSLIIFFLPITLKAEQKVFWEGIPFKLSDDLIPLLEVLKQKGFNVKFEIPPRKKVYGLFQIKSKTLWISPMTFYQGIEKQTILHEATHAAQSCPNGLLTPIDLKLPISPFLKKEIQRILLRNYDSNHYLIEKEAYYLQAQKDSINILLKVLKERCN